MATQAAADVGKRLRAQRKRAGLTLRGLAREIGTTHVSVIQWEKGDTSPTFGHAVALARTLSMSLDWLAFGDR